MGHEEHSHGKAHALLKEKGPRRSLESCVLAPIGLAGWCAALV